MPRYDVIIIGAGSSGCILANRLTEDASRQVLLLEAGTRVTDPDMRRPGLWPFNYGRSYDWAYWTQSQAGLGGRRLDWPRGKGFGGSSLVHAMAHMRGCRSDFAAWAELTGDPRWSWDGLLPFFRRMESFSGGASEYHGVDGPLPVLLPGEELSSPLVQSYVAAWESLGVPRIPEHNLGEMLGATVNSLTIRDGERVTVADGYLDPVLDRPNLHVLDNATVHTLVLDGARVGRLVYEHDGELATVEGEEVILAAGSVADPLLLMRSGIGDPADLQSAGVSPVLSLSGVGRNLHDHLLGAGNVYRSARPVPPTRLQLSEAMTYLSVDDRSATAGAADIVVGCVVAPSASAELRGEVASLGMGSAYTLLFGVTNPTSRGSLRLGGPDIDDEPIIDPAYLTTEQDRAMFRTALDHAREVGASDGMAAWRAEEVLPGALASSDDADDFIRRAVITHHHPIGTLSMGKDDAAPVTPDLRLRGVDNVYVVDASVIPSITAGPVHAAVLAIAESFAAEYVG